MHPNDTPTMVQAKRAAEVGAMQLALAETAQAEGFNVSQSITRRGTVEISLNGLDDRFDTSHPYRTYGDTELFALDVPTVGYTRYLKVRRDDIHTALKDVIANYLEYVNVDAVPHLAVVR